MKYIKLFEFLKDGGVLYHCVGRPFDKRPGLEDREFFPIEDVLLNGIQFGKTEGVHNKSLKVYKYYISTTRNPEYHFQSRKIRVVLDGDKIKQLFSVKPFGYNFGANNEWEERIWSNKGGYLSTEYFLRIECSAEYYEEVKKLKNPNNIPIILKNIGTSGHLMKGGVPHKWKKKIV